MKDKGLNLRKHLKSNVTCWICFNMLPSACWHLALIYSNSGKLTKTLVLTEITECGRNLSLHWWLLFFIFTTNKLHLLYYDCSTEETTKKQHFFMVLLDKENYTEHRGRILVLKYAKLIKVQGCILTFFISYSGIKIKSLITKLCYFFLCCNWAAAMRAEVSKRHWRVSDDRAAGRNMVILKCCR